MHSLLLTLHIVGVSAWLGGNLTQMMVLPLFEKSGHDTAIVWHRASAEMAKIYYSLAGAFIMLSGIGLVLDGPWKFSDAFVSIGFAVVIVGGVLGVRFFAPTSRAAIDAHSQHDPGAAAKVRQRFTFGAVLDTALVVFAVYAMVAKLGV